MLTENTRFVKFNMAESGGHDPQSPKATEVFIGQSPTLWDSLSNHKIILALIFALCTLHFALTPTPAFAANSGIFSLELWVKPTSSVASQALLGKAEEMRMFTDASGNPGCQIKTTTWQTASNAASQPLLLNKWNHVVCTYDKVKLTVYLNGVQVAQTSLTTLPDDTAAAFEIGEDDSSSTPYSNLTGTVDGFEFYNYALSSKQVVSDMNGGNPSTSSGPHSGAIAHYRFDEGQGTVVHNEGNAGTTLNGTLNNAASPATSTSGWTNSGKFGKGLIFDGSNDYVTISANSAIDIKNKTQYTFSAWIYPRSDGENDYGFIMGKDYWANGLQFNVFGETGETVKLDALVSHVTTYADAITSTTLTTNNWHNVLFTYNEDGNKKIKVYIDGKKAALSTDQAGVGDVTDDSAQNLIIGNRAAGDRTFDGSIDEVKIYNYALTADEVKTEYNRGSALVMGSLGSNTSYQSNATNQIYCVPGDTTSCAAPVAEWNFEEGNGTSVSDSTGNNNTGTWNGTGSHWTQGKIGKAGKFNGSDDFTTMSVNVSQPVTIEAWVKLNTVASQFIALYTADDGYYTHSNTLYTGADGTATFYIWDGGVKYVYGPVLSPGQWYHLAATATNNGSMYLYVNGVKYGPTSVGTIWANGNKYRIGSYSTLNYTNGSIDQVRIYNYARTAAQIAWDYNRGAPVGWWKMDECQGSIVNDSSGNKNNGTLTIGGSGEDTIGTCTTSSTAWGSGATGKRNASLNFDGTDDYVNTGTGSVFNLTGISLLTISAWVNMATTPSGTRIVTDNRQYFLQTNSNRRIIFGGWLGGTVYGVNTDNDPNVNTGTQLTVGTWYHLTGTYDGTTFKVYINGVLDRTRTQSGTWAYGDTDHNFYIGKYTGGLYWNGQLDDVRVYNYALTATQVKDLYNNGAINFGPVTGSP